MSVRRLHELEWTVAFVETYGWCDGDDGRPRRIRLFMVLEGDEIVGVESIGAAPGPAEFLELFERCQASPMRGKPRRPTRVRAGPSELSAALRQVEGLESEELSADELAALTHIANGLLPEGELKKGPGTYLAWANDAPQVERFFELSSLVFALRPWTRVPVPVVHVDLQVTEPEPAQLTVAVPCYFGGGGRIVLFDSERDFYRDFIANGRDSRPGVVRRPRQVHVTFTRAADLDREVHKEIVAHGWPVRKLEGYPQILARDEGGSWIGPCAADLTQAERAVASLVELHRYTHSFEHAVELPWGYQASFWIERGPRREHVSARISPPSLRGTLKFPRRARVSEVSRHRWEFDPIAVGGGTPDEAREFFETVVREFEASDAGRSLGRPAAGVRRMAACVTNRHRRALDDVHGLVLYDVLSSMSSQASTRDEALALLAELRGFWGWAEGNPELPLARDCVAFLDAATDEELVDAVLMPAPTAG